VVAPSLNYRLGAFPVIPACAGMTGTPSRERLDGLNLLEFAFYNADKISQQCNTAIIVRVA